MNERQHHLARARLLRREGKTYDEIRELLDLVVSDETLRRWLKGIPRPTGTNRSHAKNEERRRARQLRMAGATYPEIAAQLEVSMGSLSLWLSDLPVPDRVRRRRVAHFRSVSKRGAEKLHQRALDRRAARTKHAATTIGPVTDRELFFAGLALYWAEGSKDKPWQRQGGSF